MGIQVLEATQEPALSKNGKVTPNPEIAGEKAVAKASNYLVKYLSISFGAEEPQLLQLERLTWQVTVYFNLPYMQPFPVAFLDVDATTGEVSKFSNEEVERYLNRASAYAKLHAPSTATTV